MSELLHGAEIETVCVIGAGIAGLSVAGALKRAGVPVCILDQAPQVASAWRKRHPQLRLNTHRHLSSLPGLKMPANDGAFAKRETVIRYVEKYARYIDVAIEQDVRVERLDPAPVGWVIATNRGVRRAKHVVIATGPDNVPFLPAWQGRDNYAGALTHSADVGAIGCYVGKSILVVGAGNSGTDVLNHLASIETGPIWVSVRHGPTLFPTWLFGIPIQRLAPILERLPIAAVDRMLALTGRIAFGDLRRWGLKTHARGGATRLVTEHITPAIDRGFIAMLKAGRAQIVPEIARFHERTVELVDGRMLNPDVVICATGYRPGLDGLVGHLDALDARGSPRVHGNEQDPRLPGLWFTGMRLRLSGMFVAATDCGNAIAQAIACDIRAAPAMTASQYKDNDPRPPNQARRYG